MYNKNLQLVLNLTESCSPSLKAKVEQTLNTIPQELINVSKVASYYSKSTKGEAAFNYLYNAHGKTNYNTSFNGTIINFNNRKVNYDIYFCTEKSLSDIQNNHKGIRLPVLEFAVTEHDTTKSFGLVVKHIAQGGYQLSVFKQINGVYHNEVHTCFLTEEEFNKIVLGKVDLINA